MMHAEIDELVAAIAMVTQEIAGLQEAIADLDAAMAKATSIRQEEKAKNTETVGDAQVGQDAVEKALVLLKEFYAKAGEAANAGALLQGKPAIFDEDYKGLQGMK